MNISSGKQERRATYPKLVEGEMTKALYVVYEPRVIRGNGSYLPNAIRLCDGNRMTVNDTDLKIVDTITLTQGYKV